MVIIDARWETPEEKQKRTAFYANWNRKEESIKWCTENAQQLIKWHEEFAIEYPKKLYDKEVDARENNIIRVNENNKIFEEIKNGIIHYCRCGGKMRYIQSYDFCGCENYKNKIIRHDNYNIKTYNPDTPITITIGKSYLTEFKRRYKISAMASIVYKTLKAHGVKLLNEDLDESFYNSGRNASFESRSEESMILNILEKKFEKCIYQQGIKIYCGRKWHLVIPDYICINDNFIYVFDAKKSLQNRDEERLLTYHKAVEIIAKKSDIHKGIESAFIIYDAGHYTDDELLAYGCYTVNTLQDL